MVGELPVDFEETHKKIIEPYISKICSNIAHRFGDAAGSVSVVSAVFDPSKCKDISREQQVEYIQQLSKFFNFSEAILEWNMFRSTLLNKKNEQKTAGDTFHMLIVSDLADSFSCLSSIARAIVTCPIGTAGKISCR